MEGLSRTKLIGKGPWNSDIQGPRELFHTPSYAGQAKIIRKTFIYRNILWLGEGLKGHLVQALLKAGPTVMLSYFFMWSNVIKMSMLYWSTCVWTTFDLTFPNFWVLELLTMLLQCAGVFPSTRLAEAVGYFALQELQLVLAIINPTCNYF